MKQVKLPFPPNPDDNQYKGNPLALARAVFDWQTIAKGKLETVSINNDTPLDQNFVVTTGYTLTTAIAGTSTGTQVSNFICSLVAAMTKKGIIKTVNVNHG